MMADGLRKAYTDCRDEYDRLKARADMFDELVKALGNALSRLETWENIPDGHHTKKTLTRARAVWEKTK